MSIRRFYGSEGHMLELITYDVNKVAPRKGCVD